MNGQNNDQAGADKHSAKGVGIPDAKAPKIF
jgi:hypothetical protein